MVYKWAKGTRHKVDPNVAGAVCEELERDGILNAKNLVDISRPESAPLHDEFDWNDASAAEKFREHQARNIINALVVQTESTQTEVRNFFIVQKEAGYQSVDILMEKEDTRLKLLEQALRELEWFERKYSRLNELGGVFAAIEGLKRNEAV